MKSCPFCAEEIQDAAIKCKHCGEMLNGPPPAPSTAVVASSPAVMASGGSPAKRAGILLAAGGALLAVYGLSMDTSVAVPTQEFMGQTIGGGRVNNIGLMQERQNALMVGGIGFIGGLILVAMGGTRTIATGNQVEAQPLGPVEVTSKMRTTSSVIGALIFGAAAFILFLVLGFRDGQAMFMGVIGAILGSGVGWQMAPQFAAMEAASQGRVK